MTKFHFAGRYNGDPESLVTHPHEPNYVPFKEAPDMNKLSLIMNGIAIVIAVITLGLYFYLGRSRLNTIGCILMIMCLVPHEFLHAICFKGDVYMYENLKKGMLFVVGPETFSKGRFILMSMLPNIVFGFIPFIIFLFDHSQLLLGTFGALSLTAGAGDYYNVFNAATQMPKGSRTYLHGTNSFWYMPEDSKTKESAV
ncbi:MAG: DUF3267 domain-containing protein [Erysipelotrichaceae bacterium]|nr:DUF3267 domain-containing protein [Erysipelotrichaceae bacterium]